MLLPLTLACRQEPVPDPVVEVDSLGLPDCAASYEPAHVCEALKAWRSSAPQGFAEDDWLWVAPRWIGTESDPYFCADDAASAEAGVLERDPAAEADTRIVDGTDARWFDVYRRDADGYVLEVDRVMRCDFMPWLAATPPGLDAVDDFATYATTPVAGDDFFPVMREMANWRGDVVTVQVLLAWGEATTEELRLRTCGVRCGVCEDPGGGPYRSVTGVLEQLDWTASQADGTVSFEPTPVLETDCTVQY